MDKIFHRRIKTNDGLQLWFTSTNTVPHVPPAVWDACARLYAVGTRGYHVFGHALDVLERVMLVERYVGFRDYEAAVFAALFHDCVYVAGAPPMRNEDHSIDELYALAAKPGTVSRGVVDRVVPLIAATGRHGSPLNGHLSWDISLFLDCDMAGFAADQPLFDEQNVSIDVEFVGKVPPEKYRTGRSAFLRGLLQTGVFLTPPFRRSGEDRALRNIERELARVDTWMAR